MRRGAPGPRTRTGPPQAARGPGRRGAPRARPRPPAAAPGTVCRNTSRRRPRGSPLRQQRRESSARARRGVVHPLGIHRHLPVVGGHEHERARRRAGRPRACRARSPRRPRTAASPARTDGRSRRSHANRGTRSRRPRARRRTAGRRASVAYGCAAPRREHDRTATAQNADGDRTIDGTGRRWIERVAFVEEPPAVVARSGTTTSPSDGS